MQKPRIIAAILIVLGLLTGYFVYATQQDEGRFSFKLGLDLLGGTHLVYQADLSRIEEFEVDDSLDALRDVIERRVNIFGVSEPLVQLEKRVVDGITQGRLIVELPGVTDVDEAVALIGATPVLDFRTERTQEEIDEIIAEAKESGLEGIPADAIYELTELTGRFLQRAQLQFGGSGLGGVTISLQFDNEGAEIFERLTSENVGRTIAIYLDGAPISTPVVQQAISGGQAQITGDFTPEEARTLVGRLNSGALPTPITLLSTQTVGAALGGEAVEKGIFAGVVGLMIVVFLFIVWYRLPGVLAVMSLSIYMVIMLALFKLVPVTLTAAGVAGFILSIGLAVDANVLIFERIKEELAKGKEVSEAFIDGFKRAWVSIRDANLSSIFSAIILFWFGTSLIKGFALTFGIGTLVSMFSAITITKAFMLSLPHTKKTFLLGSGLSK